VYAKLAQFTTDRSLEDEPFCENPKVRIWRVVQILKFKFCFIERNHEPLHLDEYLCIESSWTCLQVSFESMFFNKAFEYGIISKLRGYVETNAELLCVELCNFVECYIFVSCLSCYCFTKGVLNITDTITRNPRVYTSPYIYV
jgi:hypothetical protein